MSSLSVEIAWKATTPMEEVLSTNKKSQVKAMFHDNQQG